MKQNFENALKHVLIHEGGYVDHPKDPGGATNRGVTLATFRRFYGASMTKEALKSITDEQVARIYREGYWDKCRCDELPDGVDYVVFDQAVNSGPVRSAIWLQQAAEVAADGAIGPKTIDALQWRYSPVLIESMCDDRLRFMKGIKDGNLWKTFGRGWQRRVDGVRGHGLALAEGKPNEPAPEPDAIERSPLPTLRRGDEAVEVTYVQNIVGAIPDQVFGEETERMVIETQEKLGIEADGIVGPVTWRMFGFFV
uniref:Lysozyme family protein n=1 Tax=Candidatus Kentrum sp. UNK TaxID=2126344 RepID=A0A450ZWU9_9GAMM|nr:MAG: Lysozyme family protein [Candidatus Kentron sp. UNK]VFK68336.1 MAG: Lysozyme family protein [Candidatus Kentron sp. UNK]